ncbi:unnamed protein product [Rotaria sp. Silwood2]|nr:unnamed protein product [Rotaria sp. Silwood2]CAF3021357.1 unnamed protein product [Rotaria sp. Silwood2]CAF3293294.1 unnamed protein product [Rotaria sp. Silwood2]CAF3369359.1 unnamed protein product [Rotaria sp. Silwood2]CAF4202606.1 unnamed protein product [Rotaria sp. Silwood2]
MFDENEKVDVLVENELPPKAQQTSVENELKQTNKQAKRKGVFRFGQLSEFKLLKEYKPNKSQVMCMVCNIQFNVHYGGKNDVVQESKTKQHSKNMLTFSIDRQRITTTIKSTCEKDETAAAEATIVYHTVWHEISYLA